MLYLAANSSALDKTNNESIGIVGGAGDQGFTNMHGPTLSVSTPIEKFRNP